MAWYAVPHGIGGGSVYNVSNWFTSSNVFIPLQHGGVNENQITTNPDNAGSRYSETGYIGNLGIYLDASI